MASGFGRLFTSPTASGQRRYFHSSSSSSSSSSSYPRAQSPSSSNAPAGGGGEGRRTLRRRRLLVVGGGIGGGGAKGDGDEIEIEGAEAVDAFRETAEGLGFETMATGDAEEARRMVELSCRDEPLAVLVVVLPGELAPAVAEAQRWQGLAQLARQETRQTFVAVFTPLAATHASFRTALFKAPGGETGGGLGANMASAAAWEIKGMLRTIMDCFASTHQGSYRCPYCLMEGLTEDGLHAHFPLYHVAEPNVPVTCPICHASCDHRRGQPFPPHLHNRHGPPSRTDLPCVEEMEGPALYAYALVVVRDESTGKFLLVQEFGASGWWLPGGRIDPGEDFARAAVRECQEEAGVLVELTGILRVEFVPSKERRAAASSSSASASHTSSSNSGSSASRARSASPASPGYCRMRVIFLARPQDPTSVTPKGTPCYESVGAAWATVEEVQAGALPLRGQEPRVWLPYVAAGGPVYPLSLLTREGAPLAPGLVGDGAAAAGGGKS